VEEAHNFSRKHGLAAKAIGVGVIDAESSFDAATSKGAKPFLKPTFASTCRGQKDIGVTNDGYTIAEVLLYGNVALRFISYGEKHTKHVEKEPFLLHLSPTSGKIAEKNTYGIFKIDRAVGNVVNLIDTLTYITGFTGFAKFTAEEIGTVDSGLNSVVLASDTEDVLFPLNEPINGRRKSQIQTYLEQNQGAGLQHLALNCYDIFETIRKMKDAQDTLGGLELMARPSDEYYQNLPNKLGDKLSSKQYAELEELGVLADEGILLQIFTKPIGDRPTFFVEIIQRIGCAISAFDDDGVSEQPGCGRFGQGHFRELFKSIV